MLKHCSKKVQLAGWDARWSVTAISYQHECSGGNSNIKVDHHMTSWHLLDYQLQFKTHTMYNTRDTWTKPLCHGDRDLLDDKTQRSVKSFWMKPRTWKQKRKGKMMKHIRKKVLITVCIRNSSLKNEKRMHHMLQERRVKGNWRKVILTFWIVV